VCGFLTRHLHCLVSAEERNPSGHKAYSIIFKPFETNFACDEPLVMNYD